MSTIKRNGSQVDQGGTKIQKLNSILLNSPKKSKSDKKLYRLVQLENNLKALLIHHTIEENADDDGDNRSDARSNGGGSDEDDEDEEFDETREKLAALSLTIGTGSFADPKSIQGLAHFVGE
jgi:nardilysin